MKKKRRIRLQAGKITAVANKYGLAGNAGLKVIAAAIAKEHGIPAPHKREDAKALIANHQAYGLTYTQRISVQKNNFAATDAFLESYEWRRVRMVALKRDGARCACCGATPADGLRMHVDHIKPRKLFPELALDADNLQVLCEVCNHGKGNWDQTDWRGEAANDTPEMQHIRSIAAEGTWPRKIGGSGSGQ